MTLVHRLSAVLALAMAMLVIASAPAFAADVRGGDALAIGTGEVAGDLIAIGQAITISGAVEDNVIVIADSVSIPGRIGGDLFVAARSVSILGTVEGAVRAGSSSMTLTGAALEDVLVGGPFETNGSSLIGGDLLGSGDMTLRGIVKGDVNAAAHRLVLSGPVEGNVKAQTAHLELGPDARIGGALHYESGSEATIAPTAVVSGGVTREVPTRRVLFLRGEDSMLLRFLDRAWGQVRFFAALAVVGLALLWAFPHTTTAVGAAVRRDWLKSIGLGLGTLFVFPIAALIVGVVALVVVGPAAFSVLVFPLSAWMAVLVTSMVFPALAVGTMALEFRRRRRQASGTSEAPRSGYAMLAGAGLLAAASFVLYLAGMLPGAGSIIGALGGFATFVVFLLGVGALVVVGWRSYRGARAASLA